MDGVRVSAAGLDPDRVQRRRFHRGSLAVFSNIASLGCMANTLRERTVLPPEDSSDLARIARQLARIRKPGQARLVGPDGSQIDMPDELYQVLLDVVTALSHGLAISIAPHNT